MTPWQKYLRQRELGPEEPDTLEVTDEAPSDRLSNAELYRIVREREATTGRHRNEKVVFEPVTLTEGRCRAPVKGRLNTTRRCSKKAGPSGFCSQHRHQARPYD